jgi:murein DD-endopeptidase MepM/ murein hydrolase activator NlpD
MSGGRHRRRTTRPRAAGALAAWVVFGLTIALAAPLTAQAETSPETPSPSPSPSVSPTPTPTPPPPIPAPKPSKSEPPPTHHGGGTSTPTPSSPAPSPTPPSKGGGGSHHAHQTSGKGNPKQQKKNDQKKNKTNDGQLSTRQREIQAIQGAYHPQPGSYNTSELVAAAQRLKAKGWTEDRIDHEIYAPFILAGPASWVDTWHALRYGPGPIVRYHEGEDVFCKYGTPVLAAENGTVEFANDSLGGHIARVDLSDGSHLYYAHLSAWNTQQFSTGDTVHPGDIIGYCGNSGDAAGGPTHVHFGWYGKDGNAIDPMKLLIGFLHQAEQKLSSVKAGAPSKKEIAKVAVTDTKGSATERDSTGYTQPLIPGVVISADTADVTPVSSTSIDPIVVASAVLWVMLGVPLFVPRRA